MNIRKIIKEELLKEVGGYDDKNIMSIHAGVSMTTLANVYNDLTLVIEGLANAVANGQSKNDFISYLSETSEVIGSLITEVETVINEFTEDDLIRDARNMIKKLNTFKRRVDVLSNFSDAMGNDEVFTEKIKQLLIDLLPSLHKFGEQLQITGHEFKHRLAGHGRSSFGSGFSDN
jgi:hypothetical protein